MDSIFPYFGSSSGPTPQAPGPLNPRRRKILKIVGYSVGGFLLFLMLLLVAFRIALARAPNYRAQVEAWVSEKTHLAIEFSKLDARWRFYGPELVFDDAVVRSQDRRRVFVRARSVSLGFDVWTAIGTGRLAAGRITLEAPELQIVRNVDGRIEVVGQHELPERDPKVVFAPDDLPTGHLNVVDAQVSVRDLKTGRGPWIIPGVSFDLQRSGSAMHIKGQADLPESLGKSLKFKADTEGKLAEAQSLDWQFNVDAREFDLAGWAQVMPADWPAPRKGRGSFQMAGALQGARPHELSMHVEFDQVALVLPSWTTPLPGKPTLEVYADDDEKNDAPSADAEAADGAPSQSSADAALQRNDSPPVADYTRVAFDLKLQHEEWPTNESWQVSVDNLNLSRPHQAWQSKQIEVKAKQTEPGGFELDAKADVLLLENLWPLLAYAPESKALAILRGMEGQGTLRDLQAKASRAESGAPVVYNVNGKFERLTLSPVEKIPGVERFSGVFTANESGGQVNLNVRDAVFSLPRTFRTPLPVDRIDGHLSWQRETTGWKILAEDLKIGTPDGNAEAAGSVFVPADKSSPVVDLKAKGFELNAGAAPRYMPAGRTPPTALAWLDRAFVAGKVPKAEFEMRGPTRNFPFRDKTGLFLITARVEALTLDYQSGWAPATNLVVDAEFRNEGMSARLIEGDVGGIKLKTGTGRFVDFKRSQLLLEADAEGDLSQALPYLQQSPVGPSIGSQFMALRGEGPLKAQIKLDLPFKDIERRKLTVNSQIADATVALDGLNEKATRVSGNLIVQDYTVRSMSMNGSFLGGSVVVKGGADSQYYGKGAGLHLSANGTARGGELANLLQLPKSVALTGSMQWEMEAKQARHAPDDPAPRTVVVESDAKGLGISLPAPIGKSAESVRALKVDLEAPDDDRMLLRGAFGTGRGLVRLVNKEDGWQLDRGGFRFDSQAASLPAHSGLRIEGDIERVVLDDWLKIKGDGGGKHTLSDFLKAANVRVGQFEFLGYAWSDVRTLMQANEHAWRVDVAGEDIAGQLTIPYVLDTGDPLRIALNKLNVGEHKTGGEGGDSDPRDVPAISGRVDELFLSGRRVGAARFVLDKNSQGVLLKSGELRGESFTASAQGTWLVSAGGTAANATCTLTLDVASTDARETLKAFNFHDIITAKRANAHAVLSWPGDIDENLLSRSSGKIRVDMADGQLLSIEPGAGRMLGLMSIAALPRRLSLDFSDVTDKGFSFDTVSGEFQLRSGDAFTDNLLVRGPAGETGIAGRTGLGKRDYDLTAVAAGDIGGSLSIASTAVGGPVLGAAVLAFTRLFKEPLKGVTRRYYKIEGSWDNPKVERIDKQEAKQESAQMSIESGKAEAETKESETSKQPEATPSPTQDQQPVK